MTRNSSNSFKNNFRNQNYSGQSGNFKLEELHNVNETNSEYVRAEICNIEDDANFQVVASSSQQKT